MTRVLVSIAVSRPEHRTLANLPGAIQASEMICAWASAAKFDKVRSITDAEPGSIVTGEALSQLFKEAIGSAAEVVEHLIVHFAGHGFHDDMDDQYLLLNRWLTNPAEAINFRRFTRLLEFYQIARVTFILDACRSPKPSFASELQGTGVLHKPEDEPREYAEERFRPAVARKEAFMLTGAGGGAAQCLFTSVAVRALCGLYPEAVEERSGKRLVTSVPLYKALEKRYPEEALRYQLTVHPSLRHGFVPDGDVYTTLPIAYRPPDLPVPLPRTSTSDDHPYGEILTRFPDIAPELREEVREGVREQLVEWYRSRYMGEPDFGGLPQETGLAIVGAKTMVPPAFSPPVVATRSFEQPEWWTVSEWNLRRDDASSVLVELDSGQSVGTAVLAYMTTIINCRRNADPPNVVMRSRPGAVPDAPEDANITEDIVARLMTGGLTGNDALSAASRIRRMKHSNPILGVVAAYLSDAAGDRDSIRRIAWFYPEHLQAIPYDVALLAGLKGYRRDGRLVVDIPAVPKREPRTEEEAKFPSYYRETPALTGVPVAGGFPWLRQGWALLDVCTLPIHPALLELAQHVRPNNFTSFAPDPGRRLASLIARGEV